MLLRDFVLDGETGIRLPPSEVPPAGYLDGAERHLFEALPAVADRSIGSEELEALVHDWPTLYHLTPYRATIFDCLGFAGAADARVLELGAGCGAITRWLGERCAEVHAVEGDRARARVARERCADLPGVHVYAANYSGLEEREAFEVVTLIGVLEYGHLYHPEHRGDPHAAAAANLRTARRALTGDGALVLAIENKLGLKYFNGAREDHSGRLFDSIHGYPDRALPATFSARELDRLLAEAGFAASRSYVAHPDYKLATTIVDVQAAEGDRHIHNWLDAPAPDRGAERGPLLFNERLAQREVVRAGLLRDLANSFLIVAFPTEVGASAERLGLELDWTARHYSLARRPCFRKRATLRGAVVAHEPAHLGAAVGAGAADRVRERVGLWQVLGEERYARGDLLVHDVLETIAAQGLGDGFARHVAELRDWLVARYGTRDAGDGPPLLRGAAFDATWWNLVATAGGWTVVDEEWRLDYPLPADYVVWRCLRHFALRNRLQLPQSARVQDATQFAAEWLQRVTGPLGAELLEQFGELDDAIGHAVAPGPLPAAPELLETLRALAEPEQHPADFVGGHRRRVVLADALEMADDGGLLASYLEAFGPDDPVTLALLAPAGASEQVAEALHDGAAARLLESPTAPDVLLTEAPADRAGWSALLEHAVAVVSERPAEPRLAGLPRFTAGSLDELRTLLAAQPSRT